MPRLTLRAAALLPTLLCTIAVAGSAHASPATEMSAAPGEIYVIVQTVPNGASQQFSFTHNVGTSSNPQVASPFTLGDGGLEIFMRVQPGSYTLTQAIPSGWELVAAGDGFETGCWDNENNSSIDVSTGVASLNVGSGESVICTFVNQKLGIPEPPPSAATQSLDSPRGIGYWRHWAGCITEGTVTSREAALARKALRAGSGTYPIGTVFEMTCEQLFRMLSMQDFAGVRKANDAAYNLAAHLLAAKLNKAAGAPVPACVESAMSSAHELLVGVGFNATGDYLGPGSGATRNAALALAGLLGRYNDADGAVMANNCS